MRPTRLAATLAAVLLGIVPARAQLKCGPFNPTAEAPAPRSDVWAIKSFERINAEVKSQPYRVLFFGDSITERWELPLWDAKPVWDANMPKRGVLNAGVSGDRTEHLRWRFDHGNLDGPAPKGVIVLIGTNDLGHGRPPAEAAEGIRQVLLRLRDQLPAARILLLGLWPRGATAEDPLRQEVVAVNSMIQTCADSTIAYADIGGVLLDAKGNLSKELSPDLLHFNGAGYARLAPRLDPLIDRIAAQ
jgi:lysophospholipase L1-like esterase